MNNPGKLNKRITFYKQAEVQKFGETKTGQRLEKVCTVYASVKAKGGTERYEAERLMNTVSYDIRTRFIKKIYDDTLIVEYEGERLEINSVVNIREENTELAFTCTKIKKGGAEHGRLR